MTNNKNGWQTKKLGDVTSLITCGVAARPKYVETGIPFLSAKNVKKGSVVWSDYKYISEKTHKELTKNNKPKRGDLLYTRVGSYGEAAVIESDQEFSIFVSLTLIKPIQSILDPYFLKYFLNSDVVKNLARRSISGSGVGNLNVGTVRQFEVPIPPLSEQKRIIKELDKFSLEIKRLEELHKQKSELIEELGKSILSKAFAREL